MVSTTTGGDLPITADTDVDGDGNKAWYTATKYVNATQTTANDVY